MAMKTVTVLKRAKKLIETKGWTQRVAARDKDGNEADPQSRKASCFCAMGAVERAALGTKDTVYTTAFYHAEEALGLAVPAQYHGSIPDYNDAPRRTKAQVLALFDRAIAKATK